MARLRSKVVELIKSWIGYNESNGKYKQIIDLYNTYKPLPRGLRMLYSYPWCACTWSAVAIKLGYTDIMPVEMSCYYLIEKARSMGIWVENDAYVPSVGDACLYDWGDSGVGDNKGNPDHIGVVTFVNKEQGLFEVTEGNKNEAVGVRTMSVNGRYIRGFICPKYDAETELPVYDTCAGKTLEQIVHEVILGVWGKGEERKKKLAAAGYSYEEVQGAVNRYLKEGAVEGAKPTVDADSRVESADDATMYDLAVSSPYKATANVNMRNGAGTAHKVMIVIPKGAEVSCYGRYSMNGKTKWLYCRINMDKVSYNGFISAQYLEKIAM